MHQSVPEWYALTMTNTTSTQIRITDALGTYESPMTAAEYAADQRKHAANAWFRIEDLSGNVLVEYLPAETAS